MDDDGRLRRHQFVSPFHRRRPTEGMAAMASPSTVKSLKGIVAGQCRSAMVTALVELTTYKAKILRS